MVLSNLKNGTFMCLSMKTIINYTMFQSWRWRMPTGERVRTLIFFIKQFLNILVKIIWMSCNAILNHWCLKPFWSLFIVLVSSKIWLSVLNDFTFCLFCLNHQHLFISFVNKKRELYFCLYFVKKASLFDVTVMKVSLPTWSTRSVIPTR